MTPTSRTSVNVTGPVASADEILTPEALAFVADLQRRFGRERVALLEARQERQKELDAGVLPDFPVATADVRAADWTVAPAPADLDDRRVEITGPAEPKMMINALNSGARVFMADLEDSLSPDLGERHRRPGGARDRPSAASSRSTARRARRTA